MAALHTSSNVQEVNGFIIRCRTVTESLLSKNYFKAHTLDAGIASVGGMVEYVDGCIIHMSVAQPY